MPNEPAGQFPAPQEPQEREVKLTDEVAPDLSTQPEPETPPPPPPAPVAPVPAALPPTRGGGFPVITVLLLLIAIGAIAAGYFFYQQTQALTSQLTEVERTLERRRIEEQQVTVTPTPTLEEVTPTATVTGAISPTLTTSPTPPAGGLADPHLVFANIKNVIVTAQKSYPNAQLLMVVATGVENKNTTITKYWFRQTPTEKKYLYILSEPGKDLSLVDQQVYLTPDNNIPSLNQLAISGGLGIDLDEALTISNGACPATFDCAATPITAQYIKANTTLWQVSYKPADGSKPFVVQIDSVTKRILFKSL
jgi:hypothetical protein